FQARAGLRRDNLPILMLPARRVARIGYRGFMRGDRVVVAGIGNPIVASLLPLIPHALLLSPADQRRRSLPRTSYASPMFGRLGDPPVHLPKSCGTARRGPAGLAHGHTRWCRPMP